MASSNFPLFDSNSSKLERHHSSSSAPPWPSDDHRPNFNHQFDPFVQYPNHHPGPPFAQPNFPPQYPHHPPPQPPPQTHPPPPQNQLPPPPPQHQPPFQHQHQHRPPPPPPPHQHQKPYQQQQNNWNQPEFHNHPPDYRPQPHLNGETNEVFGNGGTRPNGGNQNANFGRKRPRDHSSRTVPADHAEGGPVKLYVAQVPRTGTEEAVRPLFQVHGDVVEIVILRDKVTGQQQGSCFVKYATSIEADRAIRALDNQYTFPGELTPINVKYAGGDKDRIGGFEKLFVGSLNKNTTERDIEEVFSPYGFVEDIYVMRDELKQGRGCAFVKYARRGVAFAAIKALNGNFTMRGCDQPLIVRLADSKKPWIGEQRNNNMLGSPRFGHHPQPFRREPPLGPPGGAFFPNNSYHGQQNSASSGLPKNSSQVSSHASFAPNTIQKPSPQIQESSSSFPQMSLQPTRTTPQVCQPPTQMDFPKMQNQLHCQQPRQDSHQQHNLNVHENMAPTAHGVQTFSGTPNSPMAHPNSRVEGTLECDWSEHTCPDGFKYYYNCVSCESLWEKPEEFALFEQQLKQEKLQKPNHQLHSSLAGLSSPEVPPQPKLFVQKLDVQSSSAVRELDCMRLQSKASPVVGPACV